MRLEAITLENYGAFATRCVDLAGPGLTIIYGPNEAGKSTILAAITDFLFGIPHNSPRGSVFGSDAMRIGVTLTTQDGSRLELRRRKGRGKTLIDATGAPIDDGVVAALLGSTTRNRFQNLFGLGHEALREGGEHLVSAEGDIGRLIVEAGGGLRTLMARLDEIEAEAGKLFSNRRSGERVFYQALDAFTAADKQGKAGLLTRDAYEKLRKASTAAEERLRALREARRALAEQTSVLERAARVSPLLSQLGRLEDHLKTFADVARLGEGYGARVTAAMKARDAAAHVLGEAHSRHGELSERLNGLEVDPRLTALEPDVLDILERLPIVRAQRADRNNRLVELAQNDERLAALRRRLWLGTTEDLEPRLPSAAALDLVQRLVAETLARTPALAAARERIADLEDTVARLREVVAKGELLGLDRSLGVNAAELSALPSRAAALDVRRGQAAAASEVVLASCERLEFSSADALNTFSCPLPSVFQTETAARAALEAEKTKCAVEIERATAESSSAADEIARLQAGGEVPTDSLLTQSRALRDEAWAPIRAGYLGEAPIPPAPQCGAAVLALDTATRRSDDIADRRSTEAQRIAALAQAEQQRGQATGRVEVARKAALAARAELARLSDAFTRSFPDLSTRCSEMTAISQFLEERRQILEDHRVAVEAEREVQRLAADLQPLVDLLTTAEGRAALKPAEGATLSVRVSAVIAAVAAHDEAYREHKSAAKALADLTPRLASESRKVGVLCLEDRRWTAAWGPAVQALGARSDITPRSASDLVTQWASAEGIIAARAQTQRRLDRMEEDAAELRSLASAASTAIKLATPDDEVVAAQMLESRWRDNERTRTQRVGLEPEFPTLVAALAEKEADAVAALGLVRDLAGEAGDFEMDDAALGALAARHDARCKVLETLEQLEISVAAAGDGLSIKTLREECDGRSIDALRADLAALKVEAISLATDHEDAIRAEQTLRSDLTKQEDDDTVARASVEREGATARMHDAIERYLELTLARSLVTQAIAKVRAEQQDPLIRRAAALFAVATSGEFIGLEADVDRHGQPVVVGIRSTGGQAPIAIMSDGTRDQLFLAFRLASIEAYCAATEPLPFIADDVLVHFDDPRSAETLKLLAEFSESTQVILFTHERAVTTLAEHLIRSGRANLVELACVGAA